MRIDLAVGAPTSMAPELCPLGDIELCFVHMFVNPFDIYSTYYFQAKKVGRFIILDNGIMELGHSLSIEKILEVADKLKPDLLTPPEILHDGFKTLQLTLDFVTEFEKSRLFPNTKLLVAAHGNSFENWKSAFKEVVQIPFVARVGIPYDIQFDVISNTSRFANPIERLIRRRIELCLWITEHYPNVSLHLFGLAHPVELPDQITNPLIRSIDTSVPVMAAACGIRYKENYFGPFQKKALDMFLPYDTELVSLASNNISALKRCLDA